MNHKLVSIVVPCYNLAKYIMECLNSIHEQSYSPLEVIIVDDGSSDDSSMIIDSFINKIGGGGYRRSYCLIRQANQGASAARNTGLLHCTGEYIAFVDGDDTIAEKYIENMVLAIEANSADLCSCARCDENDIVIKGKDELLSRIDVQKAGFCNLYRKLYRTEIIKNNTLLLDTRMKVAEDLSFNLDYYKYVESMVVINSQDYRYRVRNDSLIHNVTIPTKQKYVLEHFLGYLSDFTEKTVIDSLDDNPLILELFWNFGILNYVQANILEGNSFSDIYENKLILELIKIFQPKSKKDKLFHCCISHRYIFMIKVLTKFKYKVLLRNKKIYDIIKRRLISN